MSDDAIIMPSLLVTCGFISWMLLHSWQRRQHVRLLTEFKNRLLDRIDSVKDFDEFLRTDGGSKFMEEISGDRGAAGTRERILSVVQAGVIFTFLGIGLVLVGAYFETLQSRQGFIILGIIGLSLGLGCLVSAVASYQLARTLGVLDGKR